MQIACLVVPDPNCFCLNLQGHEGDVFVQKPLQKCSWPAIEYHLFKAAMMTALQQIFNQTVAYFNI